ncbi:hypothetical protein V1264_002894 [Littorina saxatilis]|uniref:PHD-type domain-containing protein n=2 Tax=Littorina saxatilis TaxID=31220 RepID=A0AAN9G8M7_9CAEN
MQVQLCPQLVAIQTQLKTAIANHQMMFGNYQKDPENASLRDKLEEMQVQIKNLSNHQKVLVQQLRGQLMSNGAAATTSSSALISTACTPSIMVAPTSMTTVTRPVGPLSPRPQLVALPPNANVGIVVPLAHVQAQPTIMAIPGILNQPNIASSQTVVNLQINASTVSTAAAILAPPTPITATPIYSNTPKQNQTNTLPSPGTLKLNSTVLQPIQPRPASPPIKVPHYTINHHQVQSIKVEKSNGSLHRSYSDSDAKDLKRNLDNTVKDVRRVVDAKHLPPGEKKKQEFMACIGLVTPETLKELQNRRVERKRRSTANPHYSYTLDVERRRHNNNNNNNNNSLSKNDWLVGGQPGSKRPRGRPPKGGPGDSRPGSPDSQNGSNAGSQFQKREVCAECGKGGQLLLCGTCSLVYHLDCLSPPLATAPPSPWSCPACIVSGKGIGTLSNGALTMVNSYIATKANKEDERRRLQRKSADLLHEKQSLQEKTKNLKQQIEEKRMRCEKLTESTQEKSAAVDTLTTFIKSFQDSGVPPASSL